MGKVVLIDYTNWQGRREQRRIKPISLHFEVNNFHEGEQWFIRARALDRPNEPFRMFALKNIHSWSADA